jgi:hypothetical protein
MSSNTSLPVSDHECAASATIEAEPLISATIDFATAIRRFAPNAISTVSSAPPGWWEDVLEVVEVLEVVVTLAW